MSSLQNIQKQKLIDESQKLQNIVKLSNFSSAERQLWEDQATELLEALRARKDEQSLLDSFLQEFGLSNEEGIALMCLAESLLRIPDSATKDALIADKISSRDWRSHIGEADSLFVNASSLGLMLTGRAISLGRPITDNPTAWLGKIASEMGEPVIRTILLRAMKILGSEFVLGRTIDEAIRRGRKDYGKGAIFSFDMLGEAACTKKDAQRYFDRYAEAIERVGKQMANGSDGNLRKRSGVSIKLSALHPRYEFSQIDRVLDELYGRILELARHCRRAQIPMNIDAEEMDRLGLSLQLFEKLCAEPDMQDFDGLGLVIQAYGKAAPDIIDWSLELAKTTSRQIPIRLVKGAYWDHEIKHAQELGLANFPVYTRKAHTDISYLFCAKKLLAAGKWVYPQFATHNAHSVAAVMAMGRGEHFEFQRLHGMGELLYAQARQHYPNLPLVRTYAPVGGHADLLAYLVRRLLENGANSSFVNCFLDAKIPAREVVGDPVTIIEEDRGLPNPHIRHPLKLFSDRQNAAGLDLSDFLVVDQLLEESDQAAQKLHVKFKSAARKQHNNQEKLDVFNPASAEIKLGAVAIAGSDEIDKMFENAAKAQPQWDQLGGEARGQLLEKLADQLWERRHDLFALLTNEAGKSWPDALSEIREAIDFCRYYANQARSQFETAMSLPGPTGEENYLSLHGRGVFVCISPWNFPLAIFLGQVSAALAAGNAVIAKPAPQTPLVAELILELAHDAGFPEAIFHLAHGGAKTGETLLAHEKLAAVAFTGSTHTAKQIHRILAQREGPILPLIAETGGQNAMIADSSCLLEQLTADVITSAFQSAGQRCSALRVLFLQKDIRDPAIKMICGAMDELRIGDPVQFSTDIGPIIDAQALDRLQAHVSHMKKQAKFHYTPADLRSNQNGHFLAPHLFEIDALEQLSEEHFGPILHVVTFSATELEQVISQINSTGFGLTFGVHSRLESRAQNLAKKIRAGNLYVNRNMIGAVVGVQPFGGQGLSGTGPKAGGPHYLLRFATEKTISINSMATGGNARLLSMEMN